MPSDEDPEPSPKDQHAPSSGEIRPQSGFSRGATASPPIEDMPPVPVPIQSIDNPELRSRAEEAWAASFRLETILALWSRFPDLYRRRLSIAGDDQARISSYFPSLWEFRDVLGRCAAEEEPTTPVAPAPILEARPLMVLEISKIIEIIEITTRSLIEALAFLGLDSRAFDAVLGESELRELFQVQVDLSRPGRSNFEVDPGASRATEVMLGKVQRLRGLLTEAPRTVLLPSGAPGQAKPRWDGDRRDLWFGTTLCKQFNKQPAPNQTAILDAFQELGWPSVIDDPIPSRKKNNDPIPPLKKQDDGKRRRRLIDTVQALNRGTYPLRFSLDGTGKSVCWEASTEPPPSSN
jgi:hypothetical protein